MGAKTLLSVAQFEQLPEIDGISYELDQGELVEVPRASFKHNRVRNRLASRLEVHLEAHPDQGLVVPEQCFRLDGEIIRQPDVALVGPNKIPSIDRTALIQPFGPVLAVEIVSPSNTLEDLLHKKDQYIAGGARTVWIVAPSREVYVYTAGEHPRILGPDEMLEEPVLLPGFSVRVRDVFDA